MSSMEEEFKAMTLGSSLGTAGESGVVLAKRPDKGGTLGRRIELCANLYRIKFRQSASIAHCDVNMVVVRDQPAKPGGGAINRETSIAVWDALVASNPDGLRKQLQSAAFDNRKNAFCLGRLDLPNGVKVFRVSLKPETPDRPPRLFDVKLQIAQVIDLGILDKFCSHQKAANMSDLAATAIMALDVLLRHGMFRRDELVPAAGGRKFLNKLQATPLGEGGQLLAGLFQSIRPTAVGMVLNADTAFSPFLVTGKLLDVANAIVGRMQSSASAGRGGRGGGRGGRGGARGGFGGSGAPSSTAPFNDSELHQLKRKLKGAKVRVTHRVDNRVFMIRGFGQPAGMQVVSIADRSGKKAGKRPSKPTAKEAAELAAKGKALPEREKAPTQTMSVADYFFKTYKRQVDPKLQCVELRGGHFVPIECLELVLGTVIPPTKLTANQAANMINVAAKPPAERRAAINAVRADTDVGPGSAAAAWGLEVDANMMKLVGRVLSPPQAVYSAACAKPRPSVANGPKFLQPGTALQHWAVVVFAPPHQAPPEPRVRDFFRTLTTVAKGKGMRIADDQPKSVVFWDGREDLGSPFKRACNSIIIGNTKNPKGVPPQMIFCLLNDVKQYDEVKRKAAFDLPVAVPTQALMIKKAFKFEGGSLDQYCANVCLKLNAKLGGVNSTIAPADLPGFVSGKTLILGADVTHPTGLGTPAAGSEGQVPPSIAAVVGQVDGAGMQYAAQVREQMGRKEFITDLEDMAVKLIKKYLVGSKGVKPTKVIMFRDGVSEGQFVGVVWEETTALKRAFRAIDPKWSPALTFIVCQKRHHVRFFAANPANKADVDRTGNLPPGLVVDTSVTHPYAFDFYSQAHAGLKGESLPVLRPCTAKPVRYTPLLDEGKHTSDQLQKLVNSLCFSFARATRSVSLVPVAYYADIVAAKARSFVTDDASTTASGATRARARDPRHIQEKLDRVFKGEVALGQTMWFI
ncbi:Argonaute2 AGO2 [Rhodotorula diobovata]|uniref:Argonaute2 AGO2 n=1 Tax=Rhodotorula diobovata TaxID=5288 RepID=A0A5C5G3D5_9BASI|nr:Argonaute2 AGO2 [Rhodotorula diobovata]